MGLGGFQEVEQLAFFQKITKYQTHVSRPDRIAELTARAFDIALAERGPTQVNIPRDFFYGDVDVDIHAPLDVERTPGGAASLARAAEILGAASFPVIIAGGGVAMAAMWMTAAAPRVAATTSPKFSASVRRKVAPESR